MNKVFLLTLLLAGILTVSACGSPAPKMTLPEGAQKLTDVIPAMGEHWANPAQLPLGPIYMVYKGEVIGIEYMWTDDMLQEVEIPSPEGPEHFNALVPLPVGVVVDHVNYAFMDHGHEGFEVPHHDLHMYFITQAEVAAIAP
jgi:hypothetical protein